MIYCAVVETHSRGLLLRSELKPSSVAKSQEVMVIVGGGEEEGEEEEKEEGALAEDGCDNILKEFERGIQ